MGGLWTWLRGKGGNPDEEEDLREEGVGGEEARGVEHVRVGLGRGIEETSGHGRSTGARDEGTGGRAAPGPPCPRPGGTAGPTGRRAGGCGPGPAARTPRAGPAAGDRGAGRAGRG